jgi:hypothetical protein
MLKLARLLLDGLPVLGHIGGIDGRNIMAGNSLCPARGGPVATKPDILTKLQTTKLKRE